MLARLSDDAVVLAPAGIGGHSDHEAVRDAGLALVARGRDVELYADIPYATEFGRPDWMIGEPPNPFRDIDAFWNVVVPDGYTPVAVELSAEQQRRKVRAMRVYRTQFPMLEADGAHRLTAADLLRFELRFRRRSPG